MTDLIRTVSFVILGYFAVLNVTYLALTVVVFRGLRHYVQRLESIDFEDFALHGRRDPDLASGPCLQRGADDRCLDAVPPHAPRSRRTRCWWSTTARRTKHCRS